MPARIDSPSSRWICLAAALFVPCAVLGQPTPSTSPRWPDAADLARALKAQPLPTPERLATQPPREIPRIAPNATQPPATGTIDIAAMARQGAALTGTPTSVNSTGPLRIFITLDMPRGSLQRLVDQANRAGATLVLRGLQSQSMRKTLETVGDLIGQRTVSWVIDPDAFTRFQVTAAPTFVLNLTADPTPAAPGRIGQPTLPQCSGSSCTPPLSPASYLSIAGDVSLDYALDAMARRNVEAAPRANTLLQRLRKP